MIKNLLFVFWGTISMFSVAQQKVNYAYDNNGNRESRIITLKATPQNTAVGSKLDSSIVHKYEQSVENIIGEPRVYPNPVHTTLFFVPQGNSDGIKLNVLLVDLTGKVVYRAVSQSNRLEIDVSNLTQGVYILKAFGDGKNYSWKIIKE